MTPADDANDAHQEGYADGLAGVGPQSRYYASGQGLNPIPLGRFLEIDFDYSAGFELGSIDRRTMLAQQATATARDISAIQANMQEDA